MRKERLKTLSECGKFLGAEAKELAGVFKETAIDQKELAAELEKIKSSDAAFQSAVTNLTQLNLDKEQVACDLADALQAVGTLAGAITQNALATDQLEVRVGQQLTTLDHNALLPVRGMEQRAKDRLLQYQYFTAQAFQYRLLQPYNGTLNLQRLFERLQTILAASSSPVLDNGNFEILKGLYLDELRDIVNRTINTLNANAPERSLPATFALDPTELDQLNRTGRLLLNLRDKGFFAAGYENIRIVDLNTRQMQLHPVGGAVGGFGLCFVDFRHQGISRLTTRGQNFLFRQFQTRDVSPIAWNTLFDAITGTFNNSRISPAADSLARFLLSQPTDETLRLYSQPAADGEILITKTVSTAGGADLVIDSLQVDVTYEYFNPSGTRATLHVQVSEDLEPVISVNHPDLNGRRHGQGDFQRAYPVGSTISLQAPATHGGRVFDRWLVNQQARPAGATSLTVTLNTSLNVEARYHPLVTAVMLTPLRTLPGQIGIEFPTSPGTRYRIERTPTLANPAWTPVETLTGTGNPMTFTQPVNNTTTFFRLVVE